MPCADVATANAKAATAINLIIGFLQSLDYAVETAMAGFPTFFMGVLRCGEYQRCTFLASSG
jgi:hypothetical protein